MEAMSVYFGRRLICQTALLLTDERKQMTHATSQHHQEFGHAQNRTIVRCKHLIGEAAD
jgi:hypothetical protein